MKGTTIALFAIVAHLFGECVVANSASLYLTSFESPNYVEGSINNQEGWNLQDGQATTFRVINLPARARSGTQSVVVDTADAPLNSSQWAYLSHPISPVARPTVIRGTVYVAVVPNSRTNKNKSSRAGIALVGDTGMIGSIQVLSDGLLQLTNSLGDNASHTLGFVDPLAFTKLEIEADFGNHSLRFFVNDQSVWTPPEYSSFDSSILGFAAARLRASRFNTVFGQSGPSGGHDAVFDDFSIERIPCASTLSVGVLLSFGACRRKRPLLSRG